MTKIVPTKPNDLTDVDFAKAALELGCEMAAVKAIATVETRGSAFIYDEKGNAWVPVILFERHKMYKFLKDKNKLPKDLNNYKSIVNPNSGGYLGGIDEHLRLQDAVKLDRDSALSSASWGAFQIMGFNWKACGYNSLQEFITAMYTSSATQLDAFVGFIKSNKLLHNALKAKNWAKVAFYYNGENYVINKYDTKLLNAYNKFK
jgi:hypothetical protein